MAVAGTSCRRWQELTLMTEGIPCKKSRFQPSNRNCADYQLVGVVERDPEVVKTFLEPESPVRRQIDARAKCTRCFRPEKEPEKDCTKNLCSAKCNIFGLASKYKEVMRAPLSTPNHKQTIFLSDGTIVGRVFPMKFRIKRLKRNCNNCGKDTYLRETVTDSSGVVLLSNCCSVEVYPEKKIDNWHLVTVGTITGDKKFSKKVVSEICKLEPKKIPEPVKVKNKRRTFKKKQKKKGKKGKKSKKDKKDKKGKKDMKDKKK